ncbi:hypothetical protein Acr_26g0015170 [Actinidia rufa]|uniref:Knottins-like domain-containing protein n=1 Tax=Actinidia rufa TaxID=165716 RepID=A0A7J0H5G1_9ERIC|nr:hypothetical protein Acr_26g0015170 [Actinidia rufa]
MQAEATICSAESNSYRGMCWIHRNCQIACEKDGFLDGNCHGLRRKCICTKPCTAGSGAGGGAGGGSSGEGGDGGDGGSGGGGDGGGEGGEGGDGGSAPPLEV